MIVRLFKGTSPKRNSFFLQPLHLVTRNWIVILQGSWTTRICRSIKRKKTFFKVFKSGTWWNCNFLTGFLTITAKRTSSLPVGNWLSCFACNANSPCTTGCNRISWGRGSVRGYGRYGVHCVLSWEAMARKGNVFIRSPSIFRFETLT